MSETNYKNTVLTKGEYEELESAMIADAKEKGYSYPTIAPGCAIQILFTPMQELLKLPYRVGHEYVFHGDPKHQGNPCVRELFGEPTL